MLDSCLVLLVSCPALAPLLFLRLSFSAILSVLLFFLFVNLIVYLAYYVVFEGLSGRTLGKMLWDIEVVRAENCGPLGPGRAALRALMFLAVDGIAGVFVILASSRHQRLGDMAANTWSSAGASVSDRVRRSLCARVRLLPNQPCCTRLYLFGMP